VKILGGLTLVVIGGGMVFGAYIAGFGSGVALMAWGQEQDKKDGAEPITGEVPIPTPEGPPPMADQS
jgi:hypothetical protein